MHDELNIIEPTSLEPQPKTSSNKKKIIFIAIAALVIVGLGIGAYFLFFDKPAAPQNQESSSETSETIDDDPYRPSSEKTEDERIQDYDKEITNAADEADRLNLILDSAIVLTDLGRPGEALARLQSVDISSLSDFDLYRIYLHFAYVYDNMNDATAADDYRNLANAAYDRYEAASEGTQ